MDHLQELKQEKRWTNYILFPRDDGTFSKPPINPATLRNGNTTDPEQWTDYKTAASNIGKTAVFWKDGKQYSQPINGTGVIINGAYCGIDLDHVLKDGKVIAPFVNKFLEKLDTYAEVSVSGTGLHLLLRADDVTEDIGSKFHVDGNGNYDKNGEYVVEIYKYSNGGRYLTVTEKVFQDKPINQNKGEYLKWMHSYFTEKAERKPLQPSSLPVGSLTSREADSAILEKAFRSNRGEELRKLYSGDISAYNNDHSSADQAFMNNLAYWTNGNTEQMDSIFRSSGLMRDKWDRPIKRGSAETYGQRTIAKAMQSYKPFVPGESFSAEERKEYGRQQHRKADAEMIEALQRTVSEKMETNKQQTVTPVTPVQPIPQQEQIQIPSITYEKAVEILSNANDDSITIPYFEPFSSVAKIGLHDSVVLAGETGSGKSMLALNFMENLNAEHPVIYFNLEMTVEMVLRRLIAIHTGMELDRVEGYKYDPVTQERVNHALKDITSRKPLYVINDRYKVSDIETAIQDVSRKYQEPTIVFIDHTLLVKLEGVSSSYERFTGISEELRRIALLNNCIIFILTQQNRAGKANQDEEPELNSLKESGSFENDATHVCFIWYSAAENSYYLVLRKNRKGKSECKWFLDVNKSTQTIKATEKEIAVKSFRDIAGITFTDTTKTRKRRRK